MTKVLILCGGLGTRIGHETKYKPKPMIKIDDKPILWHVMKIYKKFGYNDFILSAGYKYEMIKKYFKKNKDFNVKVVNTGLNTNTGGRVLLIKKFIKNDYFFMTYGDGLSDVNINKLLKFHLKNKGIATLTAVHPPVRFGEIKFNRNSIKSFVEKPQAGVGWINGGFFVLSKEIFNYINDKKTVFERNPLTKLSKKGKLFGYKHDGFWQCMDTVRDKNYLRKIIKVKRLNWLNY
tara:strand:- start:1078 stop:1779 length:702 start_codon:yes stop_codon:yes gene_type:complete